MLRTVFRQYMTLYMEITENSDQCVRFLEERNLITYYKFSLLYDNDKMIS
jgi:hypothetical protein